MTLNSLSSIDSEIADRLESDDEFQRQFIRFWAANDAAGELRNLRQKRRKTQKQVAELTGTGQSAISRIEKADYEGWSYKTFVAIGEKLRARVRITFEPIEDVIKAYREVAADDSTVTIVATDATAGAALLRRGVMPTPLVDKFIADPRDVELERFMIMQEQSAPTIACTVQ